MSSGEDLKIKEEGGSGQDGGIDRNTLPPHTTKRRITNLQTNKQTKPELPENQAVWKSDNQGVKEETFIQTGRRGRDRQTGGEDAQQGSSWWTRWVRQWLATR